MAPRTTAQVVALRDLRAARHHNVQQTLQNRGRQGPQLISAPLNASTGRLPTQNTGIIRGIRRLQHQQCVELTRPASCHKYAERFLSTHVAQIGDRFTAYYPTHSQYPRQVPHTVHPTPRRPQYTVQLHTCAPAKRWHTNKPPCQLYWAERTKWLLRGLLRGLREPNGPPNSQCPALARDAQINSSPAHSSQPQPPLPSPMHTARVKCAQARSTDM